MLRGFNQSDYIALASAVVALCALAVSVWQGYLSRQHNRLMVRPRLEVVASTNDSDLLKIALRNGGLGPAILRSVSLRYNGDVFDIENGKAYEQFVNKLLEGLPWSAFKVHIYLHDRMTHVLAGESIAVLRVEAGPQATPLTTSVRERLSGVAILVEYSCVYGKPYVLEKRSLAGSA